MVQQKLHPLLILLTASALACSGENSAETTDTEAQTQTATAASSSGTGPDGSETSSAESSDGGETGSTTGDDAPACHPATVDASLCDPAEVEFTLDSTNPWYPLVVGSVVELAGDGEGDEEGIYITVTRTVLDETAMVAGVETHILRHETYFDGVIHEVANNYYVETTDGVVCYFGEDVEFYDEDGEFENTDGTWKAGEDGAMPGVIMPAAPKVGDAYYQEVAPGIALDQGRIDATDLTTTLEDTLYDTIRVIDTNPIDDEEPCTEEEKRYALGIGEVKDTVLEVVSYTP